MSTKPRPARPAPAGAMPTTGDARPRPPARTPADPNPQVDLNKATASSAPKLPHEHDEKTGMTGGVPSPDVQQGARDLKRGLQDTSRAAEAGATYDKLKQSS